jgi:hypothetical protein
LRDSGRKVCVEAAVRAMNRRPGDTVLDITQDDAGDGTAGQPRSGP